MEAKFTKGPWIARGTSKSRIYGMERNDKEILVAATGGNEANGFLIAAAPEMYDEIKRDIEHLEVRARSARCEEIKLRLVGEMTRKINLLSKARGE